MKKSSYLGAAIITGAAIAFPAIAADSMDNLIVSANRTPQPVANVGSSVSIIDREMIEERKPVFVSDLLQDLPGVAVSRAGGFGAQTQVRVRGGEANHMLVFIDGIQANDPTASDEFTFEQLTSWDVERIEVVRGPQSALWGSDAMAGVISITTRRSETGKQIGAFAETGSFGSTFFGGHAGSNFDRGTVDFSASAYDTDGENISERVPGSTNEKDGYENVTASLSGSLQATDQLRLSLFSRYSDASNDFDEFSFATGLPSDAPLESDVELFLFRATGELALLDKRWNHLLQFTYSGSDRENKDSRPVPDPVDYEGDRYGFYYQTSYDFTGAMPTNRLTLAVDHERDDYQQSGDLIFGSDPNQNQEIDNTGVIAEYLLQPLDALNLSASIRYDDNSDFDDETTWRLAGTWRFEATDTRLHASAGKGQKAPTFVERFGFFPNDFVGNPDLKPEESTGFDLGLTQGLFEGRAQIDITYFSDRVEDEINGSVFDAGSGNFTAENQSGTSRRQGFEFELQAELPANIDARASYTYTNAKEPDANGGNRREIRRPEHMAALNLNYKFLDDRARLNLNVSYTGEQDDDFFPPPTFARQTVELDQYTLVNLVASYEVTEAFSVYARAENLFDKDYENVLGYQTLGDGYYAGVRMRLR